MRTFNEFLKQKDEVLMEMPLKHYGYIFNKPGDQYVGREEDENNLVEPLGKDRLQIKPNAKYSDDIIQGRYTKRDKVVISHPKTFRTLEQRLSNSKYNFNILFIEERKKSQYLTISRPKNIFKKRPELSEYLKSNGIDTQNSITFIQVGSSGHILTPWMILHRIGHGVASSAIDKTLHPLLRDPDSYPAKTEVLSIIYRYFPNGGPELTSLFKFKSAVNKTITSDGEFVHELIAEYLWNGKIRSTRSETKALKMMDDLGAYVDLLLESCVGKILTVGGE